MLFVLLLLVQKLDSWFKIALNFCRFNARPKIVTPGDLSDHNRTCLVKIRYLRICPGFCVYRGCGLLSYGLPLYCAELMHVCMCTCVPTDGVCDAGRVWARHP